jgi:hypothetical protein
MQRFLLTIATLALLVTPVQAGMKYPNWFAFEMVWAEQKNIPPPYRPYFQCHYTTQACLKGYAINDPWGGIGNFVGVLLDGNDRKTELRHLWCTNNFDRCADYDVGLTAFGKPISMPDMPLACVELLRTTGKFDDRDGPCKGYDIGLNYFEEVDRIRRGE